MAIRIASFTGEVPRLIPRLLPNSAAQVAENTKLENGAILPIRHARLAHHFQEAGHASIYLHNSEWLSWPAPVNVAPAPVAENRLYVTGDGVPKLRVGTTEYPLAVPRPLNAVTTALASGTPDPALEQTVLYTYTWVTQFDEESEPAPLSAPLAWSPGLDVQLTGFLMPAGGRGIERMRIYRSQTSALGDTELYFIHERAVSNAPFTDVVANNPLGESIPSTEYNAPPDNLAGIVAMPNGIMAAFVGKRLYFSEPYRPHAWPEKYVLTVDYPIVGLGVFGSAIAVLTAGQPYVVAGTTPESMSMEKLEVNQPCVSARGIVDMGFSIAYPSQDGLVVISQSGAKIWGRELISRDDWRRLNPFSFVAAAFDGRYMASYAFTDEAHVEHRGMAIIDLTGSQPFMTRGSDDADAVFTDLSDGALYLLKNGQDVYEWDAYSMPYGESFWRSKRFILPTETNFGAILVEGEGAITPEQRAAAIAKGEAIHANNQALMAADATDGEIAANVIGYVTFAGSLLTPLDSFEAFFMATVYADGVRVADIFDLNKVVRLPAGFMAKTWEIEVRGNQMITAISIGMTPSDLGQG